LNQRELIEESSGTDITPKVKSRANAHRQRCCTAGGRAHHCWARAASDRAAEFRAQGAIFRAMKKLLILKKAAPRK
jgi:hypothetical protein